MSDRRDAGQKLLRDVVRAKRERDAARNALEHQSALLDELRAQLVAEHIHGRLLRLEDFHLHIGLERVVDVDGRVDWERLEALLSDLLRRRPELAGQLPESVGGGA